MADFFQKITEQQGTVEDLLRKIPGFKGYLEKNDRRDADRLLREQLARTFEDLLAEFGGLQKEIVEATGLEHMERTQSIDTKLRTFIDRIQSAAQGYAGLFDAIKIKEDALARVYAFDNALFAYAEQFKVGLEAVSGAIETDDLKKMLRQLESVVNEANKTFKRRIEAMQDLNEAI